MKFSRKLKLMVLLWTCTIISLGSVRSQNSKNLVVQSGHKGKVLVAAFSPNGEYYATGGEDHTILIWEWRTRRIIRKLRKHTGTITLLEYSSDGSYLFSGGSDLKLLQWDAKTGELIKSFDKVISKPGGFKFGSAKDSMRIGHYRSPVQISLCQPDILISKSRSEVIFWSLETGDFVKKYSLRGYEEKVFIANEKIYAFTYNGMLGEASVDTIKFAGVPGDFFASYYGSIIEGIDLQLKPKNDVYAFDVISSIEASADRDLIAVAPWYFGKKRGAIAETVWIDSDSMIVIPVIANSYNRYDPALTAFGEYKIIEEKDPFTLEKQMWLYDENCNRVSRVLFAGQTGNSGKASTRYTTEYKREHTAIPKFELGSSGAVFFNRESNCENSIQRGDIILLNKKTGKFTNKLQGHQGTVSCLKMHPSRDLLYSFGRDFRLKCWNVERGIELHSRSFPGIRILDIQIHPLRDVLLLVGYDLASGEAVIKMVESHTLQPLRQIGSLSKRASQAFFGHNNNELIIYSGNGSIHSIDLRTGNNISKNHLPLWAYANVSVTPRHLAYTDCQDSLHIRRTADLSPIQSIAKPAEVNEDWSIKQLWLSDSGRYILMKVEPNNQFNYTSHVSETVLYDSEKKMVVKEFSGSGSSGSYGILTAAMSESNRSMIAYGGYAHWASNQSFGTLSSHDLLSDSIRTFTQKGEWLPQGGTKSLVMAVCYSPDAKWLVSGGSDGGIFLWSVDGKEDHKKLTSHSSRVSCVTFSPDGQVIATASSDQRILLHALDGGLIHTLEGHGSPINSLHFDASGKQLVSVAEDGDIKIWDVALGKEIVTILMSESGDGNIMFTPDFYYRADRGTQNLVGFNVDNQFFSFEQFDISHHRPDKVLSRFGRSSEGQLRLLRSAYKKRQEIYGQRAQGLSSNFSAPRLSTNFNKLPLGTNDLEIELNISAYDENYELRRLNIWVNNVPVFGARGTVLDGNHEVRKRIQIPLSNGRNQIQLSVTNSQGVESYRQMTDVTCNTQVKPRLFIVALGASTFDSSAFDLDFPLKDARDIIRAYTEYSSAFDEVIVDSLFNQEFNSANIERTKSRLLNSKVNDQVIIFFSGHGLLDDSLNYFFATSTTDFDYPENTAIPYALVEELLDSIPARNKVMFIDACHSGEVDAETYAFYKSRFISDLTEQDLHFKGFLRKGKEQIVRELGLRTSFELMKYLFADLRMMTGATVISSSSGAQSSYEGNGVKNGTFTYCLLKGLRKGGADLNGDNQITISELQQFVATEVPKLTHGIQQPTYRVENIANDFIVW